MKKKKNDSDDDDDDEDERKKKSDEKKVARTLLQAREFKVCKNSNRFLSFFLFHISLG